MNLQTAKVILELPEKYTNELIKKNYHRLAIKYHPDKCKDLDANIKFSKLNEAYHLILKNNETGSDFLKAFNSFFQKTHELTKKKITITLTPKEYCTGCTKEIPIYSKCNCEQKICTHCAGSGYEIPDFFKSRELSVCLECMGGGVIQNCSNCNFGNKKIESTFVDIPKQINLDIPFIFENFEITLKLSDSMYFYKNDKLYCYFDISLKESLTGFKKSFNDVFGYKNNINVKCIIKNGDGYRLKNLILIFRIIYPEYLSSLVISKLKDIDF